MPKRIKIQFCEQAPTQYFNFFGRMTELLVIFYKIFPGRLENGKKDSILCLCEGTWIGYGCIYRYLTVMLNRNNS